MRLTILGCGPSMPRPGGACSGYLVQSGETKVLLDCGTGVLSNLMLVDDYRAIDAIVLSHWHADHWLDLVPYRYGLMLTQRGIKRPPRLLLPPGGEAVLEGVTRAFDASGRFFGKYFTTSEYDPDRALALGPFRITFARTRHPLPTYAIRVATEDRSFVYSADTGQSDRVERLAERAGVLLCEATMQGAAEQPASQLHMTARQAAELASRARVGLLLLTHIWPEIDPQQSLSEAKELFPQVRLARELETFDVAPHNAL